MVRYGVGLQPLVNAFTEMLPRQYLRLVVFKARLPQPLAWVL